MAHLLAGLILVGLGVWGIVTWWNVFGMVMRGVVPFVLLMLGLVALLAGYRKKAQVSAQGAGRGSEADAKTAGSPGGAVN
jgi:hypothetical protein